MYTNTNNILTKGIFFKNESNESPTNITLSNMNSLVQPIQSPKDRIDNISRLESADPECIKPESPNFGLAYLDGSSSGSMSKPEDGTLSESSSTLG